MMKKIWVAFLVLGLFAGFAGKVFAGQADAKSSDKTQPIYDIKGQVLVDLQDLQKKFTALAGAVPQDKYGWRPAEGVRSIGEVYLHITQANYGFIKLIGGTPAVDFTTKDFEKSTTDKAKIVEQMNTSFEFARTYIDKMTNADIQTAMKQFGPDANKGDIIYLLADHAHEHLGQSIAYARVNGIIPPWTVEAMKKKAAKDAAPQE
jgi:uncharacterized damage-inducible protein DinB